MLVMFVVFLNVCEWNAEHASTVPTRHKVLSWNSGAER